MRTLLAASAVAIVLVSASACSSTSNGHPTGMAPGSASVSADLSKYLLTVADVGGGFTAGTYTPAATGQPCTPNDPPLNRQVPPAAYGGRTFDNVQARAEFGEELLVYGDEATAKRALTTGEHGMDCTTGKLFYTDGTTGSVTIKSVGDITSQIDPPVDDSAAWSLANSDLTASLVVLRAGVKLIVLTLTAPTGADTSSLPDSLKLTDAAASRAINGK